MPRYSGYTSWVWSSPPRQPSSRWSAPARRWQRCATARSTAARYCACATTEPGALSGSLRPHEGARRLDRPLAGLQLGMKQRPDMDHLRPDLEFDAHVGGAGQPGEADRIVEQRLGGTDLDQQRRQAREIGIERRRERRAGIGAVQIEAGHLSDALPLHHRI